MAKAKTAASRRQTNKRTTGSRAPALGQEPEVSRPVAGTLANPESDVMAQEALLDRARTQWQFGDWDSLAALQHSDIAQHPARATLALLIAGAWQQLDDSAMVRRFVKQAHAWGSDKRAIASILVAGVHNTLGRAAALAGEETQALTHFRAAVQGVGGDPRLACQARAVREVAKLDLLPEAARFLAGARADEDGARAHLASPDRQASIPGHGVEEWVDRCLAADDVHGLVDEYVLGLEPATAFRFYCLLSARFHAAKDNLTALHFLACAREAAATDSAALYEVAERLQAMGRHDEALDAFFEASLAAQGLSEERKKALLAVHQKNSAVARAKQEHGHELLLSHLQQKLPSLVRGLSGRQPVMIEIGTTRENVPGQGSTRKLAEYCSASGIHFITVDMDPHNTRMAARMFVEMGVEFEAVNQKGEDFLRGYAGSMDFVFLDAYDFDHGKHSALRQSRYKQFLGSPIDEQECHRMHLDCAESVVAKLSPFGVVCVDDTWLEDDQWTAKGTLAVPYLLSQGYTLIEARNRAALLAPADGD